MKDIFILRITFQLIIIGIVGAAYYDGYGCPNYSGPYKTGNDSGSSTWVGVIFPLSFFVPAENITPKCK